MRRYFNGVEGVSHEDIITTKTGMTHEPLSRDEHVRSNDCLSHCSLSLTAMGEAAIASVGQQA